MLKPQSKFRLASDAGGTTTPKKSTDAAIKAAVSKYGDKASLGAAWCAFAARCEGRDEDYRFWLNVFKGLTVQR